MGDSPQIVNQQADETNTWVDRVANLILQIGQKYAEGQFAFLAVWPLSWIFEWATKWAMGKIALRGKQLATKIVIDHQVDKEVDTANTADGKLLKAILSGDQNEIEKASDEDDKAAGDLIHYDGSASDAH